MDPKELEKIKDTNKKAAEAKEKEAKKAEAEKAARIKQIQDDYNQYQAVIKESDVVIADLENRLTKQREARLIFLANVAKLQEEYAQLTGGNK